MIGEEQEVWVREVVATIGKEKTYSGRVGAVVRELEHWVATFPMHTSPTDPQ